MYYMWYRNVTEWSPILFYTINNMLWSYHINTKNITCHLVNHISISQLIWYLSVQNQISDVVHSISDPLKKYYHILPYVVWYSYHALYRISPIMWCHISSCIITLSLNICLAPTVFASSWCLQDYKMLSSGSCWFCTNLVGTFGNHCLPFRGGSIGASQNFHRESSVCI